MGDTCRGCEAEQLRERLAEFISARSVIVGIGNRQKGDDGFGPAVVDALEGKVAVPIIDAGMSPENFTQRVAAYEPDTVLFVDAAELGRKPGRLGLYSADDLVNSGLSTHAGNVSLIAQYIRSMTGAKCLFLLVQPADVKELSNRSAEVLAEPGTINLSSPVQKAVEQVCRMILFVLNNAQTPKV